MEQFELAEEEDSILSSNTKFNKYERYEILDINSKNTSSNITIIRTKKNSNYCLTKIKNISYIYFVDIFAIILTISMAIAYAIIKSKYIVNYKYEDDDIYLKPKILEHKYSRITFNNGIVFVLTQVDPNDTAGGAIAFDKGYLNDEYKNKSGYLNLALTNLVYNLKYNKKGDAYGHLYNYLGKIKYLSDEDYSCFYFSILNNGFLKYLNYFSELLYLKKENKEKNETIDERLDNNYINDSLKKFPEINKEKNEDYLLEFLIYGYKDEKGNEILPQGTKDQLKRNIENNSELIEEIKEIMKGLLNTPSNIRVMLFSHHKPSILRKTLLKYFKILFQEKKENQNKKKNNENNIKDFNTSKIIYYVIDDDEINYIKINYYINNINISDEQQFNIDVKYFNYIKHILQETKNGSLYKELNDNALNISVKSISSNIRTILKNKIIFSIKIELNRKSYSYIKIIIEKVYNYIQKIKNYIQNLNYEDKRVTDIFQIFKQDFTFIVDEDDEEDFAIKTKKLFYLDNKYYFLKDDWFPNYFTKNIHRIRKYFEQLTVNNSVIILGINNYTKNTFNLTDINYIFDNNIKKTNYSNLTYTINDLSDLNLTINENDTLTFNYTGNIYISNNSNETIIDFDDEDEYRFFENPTEKICNSSSDTYRFFLFKDSSFKVPKVFMTLYIFHPFLRPNLSEDENHNLYFQLMLYVSYLKDEINNELADAIRAGSKIKADFFENYIYIDIYSFNDNIHKIIEKIAEIISNSNNKIPNNYDIYRDYALELLKSKKKNFDNKIIVKCYELIYDDLPLYNYFDFPIDKFKDKQIKFDSTLFASIIQAYIYGYYSTEETENICEIFNKYTNDNFKQALIISNLTKGNINKENFVSKLINRTEIIGNITDTSYQKEMKNKSYFFKKMSNYTFKYHVYAYIIEDIFDNIDSKITIEKASQKYIHLKIKCEQSINCTVENIRNLIIKEMNNSHLNDSVDLIGDRFFYYLRNTQNRVADKHDTLRTAAIQKAIEHLYETSYANDTKEYFDISFDEFKKEISDLNNMYPNFIMLK